MKGIESIGKGGFREERWISSEKDVVDSGFFS